ncbi:MAG: hypothetical protein Q4F00_05675 [bacterium]|nr:hypothetical protein [bacterium]
MENHLAHQSAEPKTSLSAAQTDGSATPDSPEKSQKKFTPLQYALMSAFVYPGTGQLARRQKRKGWLIIAFFSIFLIWWLIWLALGIINLYGDIFSAASSADSMEVGASYLKLSLIPGAAVLAIFVYSIYDAYIGA